MLTHGEHERAIEIFPTFPSVGVACLPLPQIVTELRMRGRVDRPQLGMRLVAADPGHERGRGVMVSNQGSVKREEGGSSNG